MTGPEKFPFHDKQLSMCIVSLNSCLQVLMMLSCRYGRVTCCCCVQMRGNDNPCCSINQVFTYSVREKRFSIFTTLIKTGNHELFNPKFIPLTLTLVRWTMSSRSLGTVTLPVMTYVSLRHYQYRYYVTKAKRTSTYTRLNGHNVNRISSFKPNFASILNLRC